MLFRKSWYSGHAISPRKRGLVEGTFSTGRTTLEDFGADGETRTLGTGVSPYNGLANSTRPLPIARNQPDIPTSDAIVWAESRVFGRHLCTSVCTSPNKKPAPHKRRDGPAHYIPIRWQCGQVSWARKGTFGKQRKNVRKSIALIVLPDAGARSCCPSFSYAEIGTDVSRFRNASAFASWLGLCPENKISSGKVLIDPIRVRCGGCGETGLIDQIRRVKASL